jgi:ABC-type multidrug transport system fused ATPase/permease subunit
LEILDALTTHRQGSTLLLIAHRFGSLRHCDLILEIQAGAIARSGTYDELMAVRDLRQAAW